MAFRYHGRSYAEESQTEAHASVGNRNVLSRIDNILNFIQSENLVDMMKSQGSDAGDNSHICMSRSPSQVSQERKYPDLLDYKPAHALLPQESPRFPPNGSHTAKPAYAPTDHYHLYQSLHKFIENTFDSLRHPDGMKPELERSLTRKMRSMKGEIESYLSSQHRPGEYEEFTSEEVKQSLRRQGKPPRVDAVNIATVASDKENSNRSNMLQTSPDEIMQCFNHIVDNLTKLMRLLPNEEQRSIVKDIQEKLMPESTAKKTDPCHSLAERSVLRGNRHSGAPSSSKKKYSYETGSPYRRSSRENSNHKPLARQKSDYFEVELGTIYKLQPQKSSEFFTFHESDMRLGRNMDQEDFGLHVHKVNLNSIREDSLEDIVTSRRRYSKYGDVKETAVQVESKEIDFNFDDGSTIQRTDPGSRGWEQFEVRPSLRTSTVRASGYQESHLTEGSTMTGEQQSQADTLPLTTKSLQTNQNKCYLKGRSRDSWC